MLTHENLVAGIRNTALTVPFRTTSVHISYLPLAHVYVGFICWVVAGMDADGAPSSFRHSTSWSSNHPDRNLSLLNRFLYPCYFGAFVALLKFLARRAPLFRNATSSPLNSSTAARSVTSTAPPPNSSTTYKLSALPISRWFRA